MAGADTTFLLGAAKSEEEEEEDLLGLPVVENTVDWAEEAATTTSLFAMLFRAFNKWLIGALDLVSSTTGVLFTIFEVAAAAPPATLRVAEAAGGITDFTGLTPKLGILFMLRKGLFELWVK